VNAHRFGLVLLAASVIVILIGAALWMTGVPDDGRYHVEASNPFEMISENRVLIERRQQSRMPLMLGGVGCVLALAIAAASTVAARRAK
jgi:hypothetical protein